MNQRNFYLFVWKNVRDRRLLLDHALWFFVRPFFFLLKGRPEFLWGFCMAWPRLFAALRRRAAEKRRRWARTDSEILEISNDI